MKKIYILSLIGALSLYSCTKNDSFTITNSGIGPLNTKTVLNELEKTFENDSIVRGRTKDGLNGDERKVMVYEKGGLPLLTLTPKSQGSDSPIVHVRILDERYKTEEGIGLSSTFKDIEEAYTIKRIDNLLDAVVIFVEESDVYFTIDKIHLPAALMFNTEALVETSQIPDDTPIKYVMLGW